jgi:hypothetical protein
MAVVQAVVGDRAQEQLLQLALVVAGHHHSSSAQLRGLAADELADVLLAGLGLQVCGREAQLGQARSCWGHVADARMAE